jgi:hypothetical protein
MDETHASRLATWLVPDGSRLDEHLLAVTEHPRFPAAARKLSENNLAIAKADPAIDAIVKDAGRYGATMLAIYLHASGGLTLPRLKEFCARTTVISPGRSRAILLFLRFLRYIEPAGGRPTTYVPTQPLLDAWHRLMRATLEAAQILEPATALVSNRLSDPAVMLDFTRHQVELGLRVQDLGPKDNAFWLVILNRHAGTQILHHLMLSAGDTSAYPPTGPIAFSATELARTFRVSRPHVARLIKAGEQQGLFVCHSDGTLTLTEQTRRDMSIVIGLRLWTLIGAAASLYIEQAPQAAFA